MKLAALIIGLSLAACTDESVAPAPGWTLGHETADGGLQGVWGSRVDDVWAVGGQAERSLILHNDGTSWRRIDVPFSSLLVSIYGFSDSDIYAVGEHGLILHFDGRTWTRVESGTTARLSGLWGASGDDVWIVGGEVSGVPGSGVALRGTHRGFERVVLPAELEAGTLFKAHGTAPDDVILLGAAGAVLRWNGSRWARDAIETVAPLFAAWGRGADDVYAVGGIGSGEMFHHDGQQWQKIAELPSGRALRGVFTQANRPTYAVGPGYVFEVGDDGHVTQAVLPELADGTLLHGVWGDEEGTVYAVGGDLDADPHTMGGVILTRR